jgi:hypothetical protein
MSDPGTAVLEAEAIQPPELDAKRFNTLVVPSSALGLFSIYKGFSSITKAADEAESFLGLLAPPKGKSQRKRRPTRQRARTTGKK